MHTTVAWKQRLRLVLQVFSAQTNRPPNAFCLHCHLFNAPRHRSTASRNALWYTHTHACTQRYTKHTLLSTLFSCALLYKQIHWAVLCAKWENSHSAHRAFWKSIKDASPFDLGQQEELLVIQSTKTHSLKKKKRERETENDFLLVCFLFPCNLWPLSSVSSLSLSLLVHPSFLLHLNCSERERLTRTFTGMNKLLVWTWTCTLTGEIWIN